MALMLQQKQAVVNSIIEMGTNANSAIVADFKGLKSNDMTELRSRVRALGNCDLKVVRNTLAKKAFTGTVYEQLVDGIKGSVVIAFIKDDPSMVAKLLRDFTKEKEKFSINALLIDGKLLDGKQLDLVANLPTKQDALTLLVTVLNAPIVKFVRTLIEPVAKLTRTVAEVSKTK